MKSKSIKLERLDHFALTVRDIEKSCSFFESVLGMARESFGEGRVALRFGDHKIHVNSNPNENLRKAAVPVPGSAEFCFVSDTPLGEFVEHLNDCGVDIEYGPAETLGAKGKTNSVFFRDPDGNLIEVASYAPD